MSKKNFKIYILGPLIALVCTAMSFSWVSGCVKPLEPEGPSVGPEVSLLQIQKALADGRLGTSIYSIAVGQGVFYEYNIKIENGSGRKMEDSQLHVDSAEDKGTETWLHIGRQITKYLDGEAKAQPKDDIVFKIKKQAADVAPEFFRTLTSSSRITLHDLSVEDETIDAPMAIAGQPNCAGLPDCKLPLRRVSFAILITDENGLRRKIVYEVETSKYIPLLGSPTVLENFPDAAAFFSILPVYSMCLSGMAEAEGQKILVRFCYVLRNMTR